MIVVFAGKGIITTQKGAADAAVHHVIPRGVGERKEGGARLGYGREYCTEFGFITLDKVTIP